MGRRQPRCAVALLAVWVGVSSNVSGREGGPTDAQLQQTVEHKIANLKPGTPISVSVQDQIVALDGTVSTLRTKRRVIDVVRQTPGVQRVDSTIQIARAENDQQLAAAVSRVLRQYPRMSVYDYVNGVVSNAVVRLEGTVTDGLKQKEIVERIESIPGVQDIDTQIGIPPVSQMDDRIRLAIVRQIYGRGVLTNYSRALPPVRILVDHGHVTLVGVVNSQVERQQADLAARQVPGVFSVENQIRLDSEIPRER
jgi:osmotically-inducible protein OsmY